MEIKTVLVKDPGIMVELKRWVAKDATQHGQVLIETDLTDDAIFDRLVSDVEFRAIATQLVQRYGYLVPQLNPDSVAGKEQDMLSKERAKLTAQNEQDDFTKDREKREKRQRQAEYCESQSYDPQLYQQCVDQQRDLDRQQYPAQYGPNGSPQDQDNMPGQYGPTQPNQQNQPRNNMGGQLQRASLGDDELNGELSELPLGGDISSSMLLGGGRSSLGLGGGSLSSSRSSDDSSEDRGGLIDVDIESAVFKQQRRLTFNVRSRGGTSHTEYVGPGSSRREDGSFVGYGSKFRRRHWITDVILAERNDSALRQPSLSAKTAAARARVGSRAESLQKHSVPV